MGMLAKLALALLAFGMASCYRPVDSSEQPVPYGLDAGEKTDAAESYVQAGFGHLDAGNYAVAEKRFERALKLKPGFYLAHMAFGLLYSRTEQWDLAKASYEKALKAAPDDHDVLNNYGQFLCQRGDVDHAKQLLLKSAENRFNVQPQVPYTNLAACLITNGRENDATEYLLRALRSAPDFAPALLPMAKLLFDRGDVVDARGYLLRYENVASHSAVSLWLGVQIEHRLGNSDAIDTYKFILRKKFPDSEEAQKLRASGI